MREEDRQAALNDPRLTDADRAEIQRIDSLPEGTDRAAEEQAFATKLQARLQGESDAAEKQAESDRIAALPEGEEKEAAKRDFAELYDDEGTDLVIDSSGDRKADWDKAQVANLEPGSTNGPAAVDVLGNERQPRKVSEFVAESDPAIIVRDVSIPDAERLLNDHSETHDVVAVSAYKQSGFGQESRVVIVLRES